MTTCNNFSPDNIFNRFKVVEFPVSFVGLSTTQELNVEVNLNRSAYLKTMCEGKLLKFEDARKISASHRAFEIKQKDENTIEIIFTPKNECISKAKYNKQIDNRFVFDLRLIKVDGNRCCYNEFHSEIGRYYISGRYEYCKISHSPDTINFGDVTINTKVTKYVRIHNHSNVMAVLQYVRVTGFEVLPQKFNLPPNSSRRLSVTIKPTCLKVKNVVSFEIRNPHNLFDEKSTHIKIENDGNYITYLVSFRLNIVFEKYAKETSIESLHKLNELNPKYTYINEELFEHIKRKEMTKQYLRIPDPSHKKKPLIKYCSIGDLCFPKSISNPDVQTKNFCKKSKSYITVFDLFDVVLLPYSIKFGKVGLFTYGEHYLIIRNNTKYGVTIELLKDKHIQYSEERKSTLKIKLNSHMETNITIFCFGHVCGNASGTFNYIIDQKFYRKHSYHLQVGNPTLMVYEKNLKFGMVTTESFVTSVPVKIYNHYNVSVDFKWDDLNLETPFEIIPSCGTIPKHSCKICDILYICKSTKTKTHEIELQSHGATSENIPIELNIITRKLSIKFLQPAIIFKDIPLNLETIEKVKLENSSREFALFHVVEPLIPGFKIEPMCGIIRPKMIITFTIGVKIPCILEFAFDICIKVNNKENVIIPVSGNVVEPKIIVHPKNIYMARVPCFMTTFVPVTFQNISTLKTFVEILDTGDDNIFNVYTPQGNEKVRIFEFYIEAGQSKTVFIKVFDIFRREYEMYIPFKINELLGPPNQNTLSTELRYYVGQYEQSYENNSKVKLKSINKDISFCRITGVITVPWIEFSMEKFEIEYKPNTSNALQFTITNVSKYYLYVTILTSKLSPNFTLDLHTEENQSIINETQMKFELYRGKVVDFTLKFHPKGRGKFVSQALLYLDKQMTTPYSNLTFYGKRQTTIMTPSVYRIIFPPCHVGQEISRMITLKIETQSNLDAFSCVSKEETNLIVKLLESEIVSEKDALYTVVTVTVSVCCQAAYARNMTLNFNHDSGSCCDVEVSFCFTYCPLTLHTTAIVKPGDNPYPYFPLDVNHDLYEYLDTCSKFLEKWMFQQGFRRDLFPVIPETFHTISSAMSSQSGTKAKGMNVSYLNFVRRIAGPLMKHIRKVSVFGVDEKFKYIKEVHDTYREIINLLRSRGANLWILQAKFLLSYEQFIVYTENVTPKCNADIVLTKELLCNATLFERLNKQSWIDFILQSYKVFVMDSCFFDCVCVSSQSRDIVKVITDWYNENIAKQHLKLRRKDISVKSISNMTTDLSDGIAVISSILTYCPFMETHFSLFCDTNDNDNDMESVVINNACLIIEALNYLRLNFPLSSKDFLRPNFLMMLFLSIHLYITLPMFKPRDLIKFNPPLLRSSSRQVVISPTSQETLIFSYLVLNNNRNSFVVEKAASGENGKKMFLSVKFVANFVDKESAILLVHGYNKTRIFDTYIVFLLSGQAGSLNPVRKCKVTGPLYRPNKVDILVSSPFAVPALYQLQLTDSEPIVPVNFEEEVRPRFYVRRLNLIDKEITLSAMPKETGQEIQEHKLYLQIVCLSTQTGNSWIWFRSDIGEFFVKVTTQPRWDLAIDTLQSKVHSWPVDPCSCGEACECYRTTVLMIPHRNELMIKALRYALLEHTSDAMLKIFDQLIETVTGKIILGMLLHEGGTNISEVQHILRTDNTYRITSRTLMPRLDRVTLAQHTGAVLALPITIPVNDKSEKYSVTLTSDCGMDIRTYRILFVESFNDTSSNLPKHCSEM
ncbi:uncharacterized protein [Epargyreus clarus]|uniref:uncharacterized protein n=1 Tax=Epargyreus clarus TaxID=520877 RepID=UPI003C2DC673